MKRLPKASLAALAACVLVLGACGDDDDNNNDDPTEATGGDDTEAPSDDTEAPSDDTDAPSDDTDAPSDDTEAPSEDTDVESEDTGDSEESPDVDDFVRDSLTDTLGISDEQADCLIENMDLSSSDSPDLSQMQEFLEDCDIDPSDLNVGG